MAGMSMKECLEMHTAMCDREMEIRRKKAADYSAENNALSNFFLQAAIFRAMEEYGCPVDITRPTGVVIVLEVLKLIRIANLIAKGAEPFNESVEDTVLDQRVYAELFLECLTAEERDLIERSNENAE
jgi:hypothetical protein